MREKGHAMSLAEIAVACGFFDQAHFGRHFRRFFDTTQAAFLREQKRTRR
jgi:transcriptional regulator GlxA family with amidase domain